MWRWNEMDYKKEAAKLKAEYAYSECADMGWCDTKKCPLWGDKKGREDGFCVADTYLNADMWIEEDESEISSLESEIKKIRKKIARYRSFKKRFEEYLEERNDEHR